MTSQPTLGDPFFEMEDAARWFGKYYADDSHEAVRRMRALMVLEVLK